MVFASVFLACAMSARATRLEITSSEGWHMSYEPDRIIPGPNPGYWEWRPFGGSWFYCGMGALREEAAASHTDWTERALPSSTGSLAFYTMEDDSNILEGGNANGYFLVKTYNTTTFVGDVRACWPRSVQRSNHVTLDIHTGRYSIDCMPELGPQDASDCPAACIQDDGFNFCKQKLSDECNQDLRCVPEVARDPALRGTGPLTIEGNRCLSAHQGDITVEPCDAESSSQQWTFTNVGKGLLV